MDPKILASIINTSTARCWSSETYNPVPNILPYVPSSRNYAGGFPSQLMEKDLNLAMDISNTSGVKASLPLGKSVLITIASRYHSYQTFFRTISLLCRKYNVRLCIFVTLKYIINDGIDVGSNALQIYRMLNQQGYADKDFSVIYKFLSEKKS